MDAPMESYTSRLPPPSRANSELLQRLGLEPTQFRRWISGCFWHEESSWEDVIPEYFHTMYDYWLGEGDVVGADLATSSHKMGMTKETAQSLRSRIASVCGEASADTVYPPSDWDEIHDEAAGQGLRG